MAGTIVTTPTLGASDWSTWITQQQYTDRGFMRLSLTNQSDTTAPTIAAGGILEVGGSIYLFGTTTISIASGTASADTAVYFYAIPSGTSLTVEMNSTAPVWREGYQGFYASAASITRVIGGCYVGTNGVYYTKWLYTQKALDYCLRSGETRPLLDMIIELGEWNMDATATLNITHSIGARDKIRAIDVIIKSDGPANYHKLEHGDDAGAAGGGVNSIQDTIIVLERETGGFFDGAAFNATAGTLANRGYMYILYEG